MNKKYAEILPVGYIVTEGQRYLLLHPEPIPVQDVWATGLGLLYFSVVLAGEYLDHPGQIVTEGITYSRKILAIHPQALVMEIGYSGKPIRVWTGEYMMDTEPLWVVQAPPTLDDLEEDDDE